MSNRKYQPLLELILVVYLGLAALILTATFILKGILGETQSLPNFTSVYITCLGVIALIFFICFVPYAINERYFADDELDSEIDNEAESSIVAKVCGCETVVKSDKEGFVESRTVQSMPHPEVWVRVDHGSAWTDRLHREREVRCTQCGKTYATYTPVESASAEKEVKREGWNNGEITDDELFSENRRVVDADGLLDTEASAGRHPEDAVRRARVGNPQSDPTPTYTSEPTTETDGPFEPASESEMNVS